MKRRNSHKFSASAQGITLIEVLIAVVIMAVIGAISYQSLSASVASKEVIEDNLKKLTRVDRVWLLLEGDVRNALSHVKKQSFNRDGGEIPPMVIDNSNGGADYWLTLLRGGFANPLNFPRSEVIRVGYRIEDETLWRDVWYNPVSIDEDEARKTKVIEGVESVEVRVLPRTANSYSAGPWTERWPEQRDPDKQGELPLAVEITMQIKGYHEITRLFSLVKGE